MSDKPKFLSGHMIVTNNVYDLMNRDDTFGDHISDCIGRHMKGDWGDVGKADAHENEISLKKGWRLLSSYVSEGFPKIWIITEADRSVTTVLFPEEY